MDSKVLLEKIINVLEDKKALDIRVIDIADISSIADFFVICSGLSSTHNKTLSDELSFRLKEFGLDETRIEGYNTARWILADYKDVVVHIFHREERDFYNLERLWSDGKSSVSKYYQNNLE